MTRVVVNSKLLDFEFADPREAEAFQVAMNELVAEWLPWSQPMLGLFVEIVSEEEEE